MATKKNANTENVKEEKPAMAAEGPETLAEEAKAAEATGEEAAEATGEEGMEAAPVVEKDPWDEMVEMFVPRKRAGDEQQYYVCVNDRRYTIPANNKVQTLPRPVAEVLQQGLDADREAEEFAENIPNRVPNM